MKRKLKISLSYKMNLKENKFQLKMVNDEMSLLEKNHTLELVKPSKSQRMIGCKYICKKKGGILGVEEPRYNSRLVEKGFTLA